MSRDETASPRESPRYIDTLVVGGGQSALATAYFLRRWKVNYVVLDDQATAGGAWQRAWPSLQLFSPAQWSSLPGWPMRGGEAHYPSRDDVVTYLREYEARYEVPVERPVHVTGVVSQVDGFLVSTDSGDWLARTVISATGSWRSPYVPCYPGQASFRGRQVHSADYGGAQAVRGQRVLVVGGGNSGAQIYAEVSHVSEATWVALRAPSFLPDDIDGRVLFERATARWQAAQRGLPDPYPDSGLGHIVMVPSVRDARERGVLHAVRPFARFVDDGVVWDDGRHSAVDVVIWCTGFRPSLGHLQPLSIAQDDGRIRVEGTRCIDAPGLWLVGYGEWTGYASATLIGVMRSARATAQEVVAFLGARSTATTQRCNDD
ncbi:pyridine nucleotide-disulfide oxidoreductase [Pandoraea faecigallinarum]|uniref:Pyridine nucleotide-disulfide oxidoreductase n=1 Tax=Pandoraea faecigallinarum TaxID=656179 RepID=A0A0H3WTC5_9BURK|nr:ArsO family NAD(P)H-dependent flavin-containing monooxygenase [Pandoraea faecigallinarum]AKM31469.1 pyridine nucleotide-disulfide oxidoreductase [Pandoraea faecigallinarum]